MALTIEIQVSKSGIADAAFQPLTSVPDTGPGLFFDHTPTTPGQLYIYRARRRDDSKTGACEYSAWSLLAFARGPYPEGLNMATDDGIYTGMESAMWIGIEASRGIPTKAQWRIPYLSGGINFTKQRLYSRQRRNKATMRSGAVAGKATADGTVSAEITPEGAYPRVLLATMPVATTPLTSPTRYRHRFSNGFSNVTFTLIHLKGRTYFVYPGCSITSLTQNNTKEQDEVLAYSFSVEALDQLVLELDLVPNAGSLLGVDTASEDPLPVYSPTKGVAYIGNATACIKALETTLTPTKSRDYCFNGKMGAGKIFNNGGTDTQVSASLNYGDNSNLRRDMLGNTVPTGAYAANTSIAVVPLSLVFSPPNNGAGFSNTYSINVPNTDIMSSQPVDADGPIPENLTLMPMDVPGDPSNTDLYLELENSESNASLNMPGVPITAAPPSEVFLYTYGVATGTPTTTVVAAAGATHLSAVDGFYIGRKLWIRSGAQAGQSSVVTGYVASTKTFTVGAAYTAAPVAGDTVEVV